MLKTEKKFNWPSNKESKFPSFNCETTFMENKNYLIKKIIELENVDHWKVLFYGLHRALINDQFILDYVYTLIEQKKANDQFTLDLAGLSNDEFHKILIMMEEKIENRNEVMIDEGQFYNKIWFYLSLASDMCAEKIIT